MFDCILEKKESVEVMTSESFNNGNENKVMSEIQEKISRNEKLQEVKFLIFGKKKIKCFQSLDEKVHDLKEEMKSFLEIMRSHS